MTDRDLELIRDYLDERIEPDDLERLNKLLESEPESRAEFRAMANLEEGLRDLSAESEIPFVTSLSDTELRHRGKQDRAWHKVEYYGLAALLMVSLGLAILLMQSHGREDTWGLALARIESVSEDASFSPGHQLSTTQGSLLGKGWIQLETGSIQLLFRSGATIEAVGPAAIGIDTPMRAYLDFGKAKVHTPESARDFVVATESMEVVDLGTRFEIGVDPESRESNVTVTEGLVDLHLGSRGADRVIRPLEAGYAARIDALGKVVEITSGTPAATQPCRLLSHWKFDRTESNGVAEDSTDQQHHGLFPKGASPSSVSGISGQALEFSQGQFVDLSQSIASLGELQDFTFSAWVCDPKNPLSMIFSFSGDSEQNRIQLHLARKFVFLGWQDGLHFDSISGRIEGWETGEWYHLVVTVQDGVARLFRNAELIASGAVGSKIGTPVITPALVESASHAYLGRLKDGTQGEKSVSQWLEGKLDDVQIYSGALSQVAIQHLHQNPGEPWAPAER